MSQSTRILLALIAGLVGGIVLAATHLPLPLPGAREVLL